jgi:hypothetical protein
MGYRLNGYRARKDKSPVMGPLSKPSAVELAVGDVHRDFKAETHFGVLRLAPHIFLQKVRLTLLLESLNPESRNCLPGEPNESQAFSGMFTLITLEKSPNGHHDFH